MNDKKQNKELFQPLKKGFQPIPGQITGGHQPTTSEQKPSIPQPPPKEAVISWFG